MKFTGERFVPTEQGEIRLEHFHRYAAVSGLAEGKDVLDVACGEGYGSSLLAGRARSVVGVDISKEAIRHAARKYKDVRGLKFKEGSASALPLKNAAVDLVVSFETIEHLAEQEQMVAEIRRVLRPSGLLVISSPNRPVYAKTSTEVNPFHVKELDLEELDALLRARFPAIRYYGQRLMMGSVVQPLEKPPASFRALADSGAEIIANAGGLKDPVYFVALCAARPELLPRIDASIMQPADLDLLEQYRGFARWAQQADAQLQSAREQYAKLSEEHHKIAEWGQTLDREIQSARETHSAASAEHEKVAGWAHALAREVDTLRGHLARRQAANDTISRDARSNALRADEMAAEARAGADRATALLAEAARLRQSLSLRSADQNHLAEENERLVAAGEALKGEVAALKAQVEQLGVEQARRVEWGEALKAQVEQLGRQLAHEEERLQLLTAESAQQHEKGSALQAALDAANAHLAAREAETQKQAAEMVRLGAWVMSLSAEADGLKRDVSEARERSEAAAREREAAAAERLHAENALRAEIAASRAETTASRAEVAALRGSLSWRLTGPLRTAGAAVAAAIPALRAAVLGGIRRAGGYVHRNIPVGQFDRRRLSGWCYARFPRLFAGVAPYVAWKSRADAFEPLAQMLARSAPGEVGNFVAAGDTSRMPRASVIIPVYGQLDYTLRCLRSVLEARSRTPYEIIVVDDCSPDLTVETLANLPGIRLVGNEANQGFIRTCNRGASVARGDYLLFLNNDTLVATDWLDAMVQTFADVPACGLVGSQLQYPDGRLQEAGGVLWNDGSGWNYGNRDDPRRPEYSYRRDVDYCSGASIMIPAELFRSLGGFDEHYAPAYAEDSDLAFRVRRAGRRVIYQPKSSVIHYEGVTSGTDVTRGVKAYQVANARKLFERWRGELAANGHPGFEPLLVKDRNITGRVLVIDHVTPTPDQDAGSITALNIMRILQSRGLKVTFVPEDNMAFVPRYTDELQRIGIECLYNPYVANLGAHLAAEGHTYDLVIMFRVEVARRHLDTIELYCPQAKIVFHTSDLHHLRELRKAELEASDALRDRAARTRELELATMRRAHATIVHSATEKAMLDAELGWQGVERIFVFGWAIPIPGTRVGFGPRDGIVFVGGYQHDPNVDGVEFFVRDVFPKVRERLPRARFLVVGSKMPAKFKELEGNGVELVGHVPDLGPLLDRCRLSVAPLRYGAGTKGKIYTSLSHGLPCVSTSIGVEGMSMHHEENVLVADAAADFADAVVRLHEDEALWTRLSRAGFKYLEDHASLDVGGRIIGRILEVLDIRTDAAAVPRARPQRETIVADRAQFEAHMGSPAVARQAAFEESLVRTHGAKSEYILGGWCEVCDAVSWFRVDRLCGAREREDGLWVPNWRERCVCTRCLLNNRQRVIAARVREFVRARGETPTQIYLTEQVTPIFHWLNATLPHVRWTGSEYLDPALAGGSVRDGIRHEDVERLSFADGAFDMVVSNDVLEHVNDPRKALEETFRVLRPGGTLLMTVPFHTLLDRSRARAEITAQGLVHHLPPEYHGNPVSSDGSLVFTDFGWEFLEQMRGIGFADVGLHIYWSESRGYLGIGQHYIRATRPLASA